jgi:hypothetical protein
MVVAMFINTGMRVSTTFLPVALIFALQAHADLFDRRTARSASATNEPADANTTRIAA